MTNWYYFDNNGQKQGPINSAQLKTLAANGLVTPTTTILTEDGKGSVAGKIKGLEFPQESVYSVEQPTSPPPNPTPPSLPQSPPSPQPVPIPFPVSQQQPSKFVVSKPLILAIAGGILALCLGIVVITVIWNMRTLTPEQATIAQNKVTPHKESQKSTKISKPVETSELTVAIEDAPPKDDTEFVKAYGSLYYDEDLAKSNFEAYYSHSDAINKWSSASETGAVE
jgi:hypothetical protein